MQIIERRFTVDGRAGELLIDVYGDTHLGSKSVDEKRLRRDIEETRETGRWWCHVGDAIDGIRPLPNAPIMRRRGNNAQH